MTRYEIATFLWEENGYTPKTYATLHREGDALTVTMTCKETAPLARHSGAQVPVHLDSCLEFFLSLDRGQHYVNLEMNAGGGYRLCYGEGRHGRVNCDEVLSSLPVPTVGEEQWSVTVTLSVSKLSELFGVETPDVICGNFYKCGDETAFPHYGMWARVETGTPDFHRPEYFKEIEW